MNETSGKLIKFEDWGYKLTKELITIIKVIIFILSLKVTLIQ